MIKTGFLRLMVCTTIIMIQLAIPSRVSACECPPVKSVAEEFSSAGAVFLGNVNYIGGENTSFTSFLNEIYNILNPPPKYYYTDMFSGEPVSFIVKHSWKNIATTKVSLRSHDDCNYGYMPFIPGKDYLIYAYHAKNNLKSDLNIGFCSRVIESLYATEDLAYLNTLPTLPLTPAQNYTYLYYTGIVIITLVLYKVWLKFKISKKQKEK